MVMKILIRIILTDMMIMTIFLTVIAEKDANWINLIFSLIVPYILFHFPSLCVFLHRSFPFFPSPCMPKSYIYDANSFVLSSLLSLPFLRPRYLSSSFSFFPTFCMYSLVILKLFSPSPSYLLGTPPHPSPEKRKRKSKLKIYLQSSDKHTFLINRT